MEGSCVLKAPRPSYYSSALLSSIEICCALEIVLSLSVVLPV